MIKVERKESSDYEPKYISSAKNSGGSVLEWICMDAWGTGSFIFIDDAIHDSCRKMNSYLQKYSLPFCREMQQHNESKHTGNST